MTDDPDIAQLIALAEQHRKEYYDNLARSSSSYMKKPTLCLHELEEAVQRLVRDHFFEKTTAGIGILPMPFLHAPRVIIAHCKYVGGP